MSTVTLKNGDHVHGKWTFDTALLALKDGNRAFRAGWNGEDMYIEAQYPDENSKMERPYLFIVPAKGWTVPWIASQADIFAEDWVIIINNQ